MKNKYILKGKTMYGIAFSDRAGGEMQTFFLLDKTKEEVAKFVRLCNSEGLEPIHIKDAIDDIFHLRKDTIDFSRTICYTEMATNPTE